MKLRVCGSSKFVSFLMFTIGFFCGHRKGAREIVFPLFTGILIGLLFGFILTYNDSVDSAEHIFPVPFTDHDALHADPTFFLRCIIIIHGESNSADKQISAISDTYGKDCNETIFFTTSKRIKKKDNGAKYEVVYIDTYSNVFYWNFYKNVLEYTSETPAQWTFVGDEKTFLSVPNLRVALNSFNANDALVIGRVTKPSTFLTYFFPFISYNRVKVEAGLIVTQTAIDQLAKCRSTFLPRATESALFYCSNENDVRLADPVDEDGMHLFHSKDPWTLIPDSLGKRASSIKEAEATVGCCSDHAVTFGQLNNKQLIMMYFSVHKMKVFGAGGIELEKSIDEKDKDKIVK